MCKIIKHNLTFALCPTVLLCCCDIRIRVRKSNYAWLLRGKPSAKLIFSCVILLWKAFWRAHPPPKNAKGKLFHYSVNSQKCICNAELVAHSRWSFFWAVCHIVNGTHYCLERLVSFLLCCIQNSITKGPRHAGLELLDYLTRTNPLKGSFEASFDRPPCWMSRWKSEQQCYWWCNQMHGQN